MRSFSSEEVDRSDLLMWQEGKVRAVLQKMLNGTKDVIYEDAYASEQGFKAVSILTAIFFIEMLSGG